MFASWFARRPAQTSFAEGTAALDRGDTDLALSWFNNAVRENGRFALGFLGRGLAHLRKGEFDAAVADLSEAIRLSGDPRAYYLRSLCYQGTGEREHERSDRAEALRRDARVAHALRDPAA